MPAWSELLLYLFLLVTIVAFLLVITLPTPR